jgi:5-methylcytosine-specific restriction enzyme A
MTTGKKWKDRGPGGARGYGWAWGRLKARVLERQPLCQWCDRRGVVELATTVDHILPRARGGTDALANLQSLCAACAKDKDMLDRGQRVKQWTGLDGWKIK